MGKIKKHLTSILVFFINLTLMGVGFLFIKNSEEAKKENLVDENKAGETLTENEMTVENIVEIPADKESADTFQDEVIPDNKNIPSSTAPIATKPEVTSTTKNTGSTAPNGTSTSSKKTSTKKSSAKTKTS